MNRISDNNNINLAFSGNKTQVFTIRKCQNQNLSNNTIPKFMSKEQNRHNNMFLPTDNL